MAIDIYPLLTTPLSLGTLNGSTSLIISSALVGSALDHKMLLKRVKIMIGLHGMTAGNVSRLIVGCAIGDISVADIQAALDLVVLKEGTVSWAETQGIARRILWETVRQVVPNGDGTTGTATITTSLGGGKGIPLQENQGMSIFMANVSGNNLDTGGLVATSGVAYGVPL